MMRFKYESEFDKEKYKKQVKDIRRYAKQLGSLLKLNDWKITVWLDTEKALEKGEVKEIPTQAETNTEAQYKTAALRFFVKSMVDRRSPGDFRSTVIHEFLHVVLSPYSNAVLQVTPKAQEGLLDYAEEIVVTHMEGLAIWDEVE